MTWLNWGVGTHRAPEPWVNVDCVSNSEVHPDVIVPEGEPAPYRDGTVEKVYAGHVLEHVHWADCPDLIREFVRLLEPGGELLVCGPDAFRAIHRWRDGREPWDIVLACMETSHNYGFGTLEQWPGARHKWTCEEARGARAARHLRVLHHHRGDTAPGAGGDGRLDAAVADRRGRAVAMLRPCGEIGDVARETIEAKGVRYLGEHRVKVVAWEPGRVVAQVQGSEPYRVEIRRGFRLCTCPSWRPCSHLHAVLLVAGALR